MALVAAEERREALVLWTPSPEISHVHNSNCTLESRRESEVHTTLQRTKYADSVQARAVTFSIYSMLLGGYYYPCGDDNMYLIGQVSILLVTGHFF